MKIYRSPSGVLVRNGEQWFRATQFSFDQLFRERAPLAWLRSRLTPVGTGAVWHDLLPPLEAQEVWAAGVTYRRSREARMEESEQAADVYDRVYQAERPELFFKATAHRV